MPIIPSTEDTGPPIPLPREVREALLDRLNGELPAVLAVLDATEEGGDDYGELRAENSDLRSLIRAIAATTTSALGFVEEKTATAKARAVSRQEIDEPDEPNLTDRVAALEGRADRVIETLKGLLDEDGAEPGCSCEWAEREPIHHDLLLRLEDDIAAPLEAMVICESQNTLGIDGEEFPRFVAYHGSRWRNPGVVYDFATHVHWVSGALTRRFAAWEGSHAV